MNTKKESGKMCGRYTANTEDEVIEIRGILNALSMRLSSDISDGMLAAYAGLYGKEIYPSENAPVVTCDGILRYKFGFEKWDGSGLIINARSETISSSRFFKPFLKNRCIIPASHYFEWKKVPHTHTEKYKFGSGKSGIFMAGLMDAKPGKESFVILTKQADENISFIHERMPVILPVSRILSWLDGTLSPDTLASVCVENIFFDMAI